MGFESSAGSDVAAEPCRPVRAKIDLFSISLLILFLELACIRWFPAHVVFLTFFTNMVLLACFLGMSLGCLAVNHRRNYLAWTPYVLAAAIGLGVLVDRTRGSLERHLDVGNQASPNMVYFGTELHAQNPGRFGIPIELFGGAFFLLITLALLGPGQELGRALKRVPDRVIAYTLNILGSLVGIVLFAGMSWLELPPLYWFLPVAVGITYFLFASSVFRPRTAWIPLGALAVVVVLASLNMGNHPRPDGTFVDHLWSPYYRIDYTGPEERYIQVNLIGHQAMLSRDFRSDFGTAPPAYALPHLFHRDAGGLPFRDVLIIGAGSGNDVSRALQWGAKDVRIDAVEIDPCIQRLGLAHHPDHPYQETERVVVHIGDGRNFLRSTSKKYDLVVFALVDSLVLHSGYSNIRLESYLFSQQALEDVRRCLKPDGLFVMYNYFRQGWIVARLAGQLETAFDAKPLVLTLPRTDKIEPDSSFGGFTMMIAGQGKPLDRLRTAFAKQPHYWLDRHRPPGPDSPNGFNTPSSEERLALAKLGDGKPWEEFGLAEVEPPAEPLRPATDDWPFLYLRRAMIPPQPSLSGMAVMGVLALVLLAWFLPKAEGKRRGLDGRMFFLGAGFMLIETKAVVNMALLFGSTWMVNTVVFFAVLVMILLANLYVLAVRPERLWPYYAGLAASLVLNVVVPLDAFLGMGPAVQTVGSCLLVFTPILFAGVVFALAFRRTDEPDRAFGANIAGAMLGGLAENLSMVVGFQYLIVVALGFYVLSMLFRNGVPEAAPNAPEGEPVAMSGPAAGSLVG